MSGSPRQQRARELPKNIKRGLTLQQIADMHGVCVGTIRRECWELGLDISTAGQTCDRCGLGGRLERYRGQTLCGACLITAGDYDPDYEAAEREEVMRGFRDCVLSEAESRIPAIERGFNLNKAAKRGMEKLGIKPRNSSPGGPRRRAESEIIPYKEEWS